MKCVIASCASKYVLKRKPHPRGPFPWWRLLFHIQDTVKEDCPTWLDMGQEGGLQVRWTFCKSVPSLQFLSHDMAKTQLRSTSREQGSAYTFTCVLQTACAPYRVTRCTPAMWGDTILIYSLVFKSMQQSHFRCLLTTWSSMTHLWS